MLSETCILIMPINIYSSIISAKATSAKAAYYGNNHCYGGDVEMKDKIRKTPPVMIRIVNKHFIKCIDCTFILQVWLFK